MRIFLIVLLGFLLCVPVQADTWDDYVHIFCDEESGVFRVWDDRLYTGAQLDVGNNVQSILKTSGIEYEFVSDDVFKVKSDKDSRFGHCAIKHLNNFGKPTETNFSVVRSKVDYGNVQSQCGAANSAEFQVLVNGQTVAVLPSAKDDCFRHHSINFHPRVEFKAGQLEICTWAKQNIRNGGNWQLKTRAEICETGLPTAHVKAFAERPKQQFEGPVFQLISMDDAKALYEDQRQARLFERVLEETNEKLESCKANKGFWAGFWKACSNEK